MKTLTKNTVFDPAQLIKLVKEQLPEQVKLAEALNDCLVGSWKNQRYFRVTDLLNRKHAPIGWCYLVKSPADDWIIIEMRLNGCIAGIEFANRIPD